MNMKGNGNFIFFVLVLLISSTGISQTIITSENCNSIKVELKEEVNTSAKVLLEQQYQKNVWMKIAQKVTNENNVIFKGLDNGKYRATYVINGTKWRSYKYISNTLDITCNKNIREKLEFEVSPNPAKEIISVNVQFNKKFNNLNYEIFDALGASVGKGYSLNQSFKHELQDFVSGIYYIKVDIDGKFGLKQFVISK